MSEDKEEVKEKEELFAVFAEAEDNDKPLILLNLSFARLIDDVVFPFEKKEPFFIDGVPLTREKIRKLKILRQGEGFLRSLAWLHRGLSHGDVKRQKTYGDQYFIRFEAAIRTGCEDVTSQVIKAFDTKIKPRLKDYLPNREELIEATAKFFWEGIKTLSGMS